MKNVFMFAVMALVLSACGFQGPRGPQGETGGVTTMPVDDVQADINKVLADENEYRLGLGQTMLSQGLSCTLYTFATGDRIQASIAGHNTLTPLSSVATFLLKDVVNQPNASVGDGLNILPPALRPIYLNLFMVRCQGQIVVLESGHYNFELSSDDASLLYVDGVKVIDNDNNHGITAVQGSRYLRRGVHSFRFDYAQAGGGSQALVLKANGSLIEGRHYAH